MDLSPSAIARLPGGSIFSAALVLGLVAVLPLAVAMVAACRGSDRTGELRVLAAVIGAAAAQLGVAAGVLLAPAGGTALRRDDGGLGPMRSRPSPFSDDGPL